MLIASGCKNVQLHMILQCLCIILNKMLFNVNIMVSLFLIALMGRKSTKCITRCIQSQVSATKADKLCLMTISIQLMSFDIVMSDYQQHTGLMPYLLAQLTHQFSNTVSENYWTTHPLRLCDFTWHENQFNCCVQGTK